MVFCIDLSDHFVGSKSKPVVNEHRVRIFPRQDRQRGAVAIADLKLRVSGELEQVLFIAVFDAANEVVLVFALRQHAAANDIANDAAGLVSYQLVLNDENRGFAITGL